MGGLFTIAGSLRMRNVARWAPSGGAAGYCIPGTTTHLCNAEVTVTGVPSASQTSGFEVAVWDVEGQKSGILFFGTGGPLQNPWGGGSSFMCVAPPRVRTGTQSSGGTNGQCDGVLSLDFNAWMAANPGKAPPAGQQVWMQAWFRDPPAPATTNLSNGLTFAVCP
jgi:hypothetical protein